MGDEDAGRSRTRASCGNARCVNEIAALGASAPKGAILGVRTADLGMKKRYSRAIRMCTLRRRTLTGIRRFWCV